GIRDRNVTGVQTCALPIYRNIRGSSPQFGHLAFAIRAPFGLAFEFEFADKITGLTEWPINPEASRDCAGAQPVADAFPAFVGIEIGRASCRERVCVHGAAA